MSRRAVRGSAPAPVAAVRLAAARDVRPAGARDARVVSAVVVLVGLLIGLVLITGGCGPPT